MLGAHFWIHVVFLRLVISHNQEAAATLLYMEELNTDEYAAVCSLLSDSLNSIVSANQKLGTSLDSAEAQWIEAGKELTELTRVAGTIRMELLSVFKRIRLLYFFIARFILLTSPAVLSNPKLNVHIPKWILLFGTFPRSFREWKGLG